MKREEHISDEQIGAFIDGELDSREVDSLFAQTDACVELDQRICQHRKLKELVQHGYRDIPEPTRADSRPRSRRNFLGAVAAALALAVGATGGYLVARDANESASLAGADPEAWLIHVANGDPESMKRALDRAEMLMAGSHAVSPRQVEIIANSSGLDLLRRDVTPYASRIHQLASENILFFACSNAIDRLKERGISVDLVPEANSQFTAVDRVALRLKQGWTYERI